MDCIKIVNCVLLIFFTVNICEYAQAAKIMITRIDFCDPNPNYPIKYNLVFENKPDGQYFSGNFTFPMDLDSNIGSIVHVDYVVNGHALKILHAKEKNLCDACNRYLGQPWYDACVAANIQPKKCPISKGTYRITDYKFSFDKIPYQSLPFGLLHVRCTVLDNRTKRVLACSEIDVQTEDV